MCSSNVGLIRFSAPKYLIMQWFYSIILFAPFVNVAERWCTFKPLFVEHYIMYGSNILSEFEESGVA